MALAEPDGRARRAASRAPAARPTAASAPTTTASATAIDAADRGDGVVVLGDLGSAILTVRAVLEGAANGHVRLADAPLVEGAVAAAVTASGRPADSSDVESAARRRPRGARKL